MDINITCAEIQSTVGFLFVILPLILNYTNNPDCEQSWLSEVSVFLSSNYTITHTHTHTQICFTSLSSQFIGQMQFLRVDEGDGHDRLKLV